MTQSKMFHKLERIGKSVEWLCRDLRCNYCGRKILASDKFIIQCGRGFVPTKLVCDNPICINKNILGE